MIKSVNPATEAIVAEFPPLGEAELEQRVLRAHTAAAPWRALPVEARTRILLNAAAALATDRDRHARLLTEEMGKTIRAAREEVAKCERTLRYYAEHAARFLSDTQVPDAGRIAYQPLGVILAVMPWNFPYWQVIRFAAPALAAGNVALLKHASNVPRCALELERLFATAGAPAGVFQSLLVGVPAVSTLIADDRVAAVTLTGSEAAGRAVARTAGEHLKKCVLELGGSDPFVVLADADVSEAARVATLSRTINNGQSCIAAKRFIVERSIAEEFIAAFIDNVRALRVGDPKEEATDIGPLATPQIRDEVASQVERTVAAGARIAVGGNIRAAPGYYFEPTVLLDVPLDSAAAVEEVFGPVAPVFIAGDADHALTIANATRFGLGANVWTRSDALAERFAVEMEAGTVFINGMVASDPRFPFGGIKKSGYGRELSVEGMREFVNIKTIRRGDAGAIE
ncbi:MAG TPA: NAD-dependent succinate-semialdehyde dehydrogenase [Gemmatimonadaceae bacterium]|nr:NAD-dependent succinate-semialdehyde dehydrogenase [Gemmatimonadaceae bacterium]